MNGLIVLQARLSSTRLPSKVIQLVNNRPMIEWQIKRIKEADIAPIIVATSIDKSDDNLVEILNNLEIETYRGSLENVCDRFKNILRINQPEVIVRLTADCPLVMPKLLRDMYDKFVSSHYEYLSNTIEPTFPDGLDIEIFTTEAFNKMLRLPLNDLDKEHVTPAIYKNPKIFKIKNYENNINLSNLRWTVDYPEDLDFVRKVYGFFKGRETQFGINELLSALKDGSITDNMLGAEYRNIAYKNSGA